jgi:hypothetical protein
VPQAEDGLQAVRSKPRMGGLVTVPAAAQQQEGLINVNECGAAVNVLAKQLPGDVECNADAQSAAVNEQLMRFAVKQGEADAIRDAAG